MQKRLRRIRMMKEARHDITKLYREHRQSVICFDYENQTARLLCEGKDEGILIFGNLFEALKKLAYGAKSCAVDKVFTRMQASIANTNN